MLRWLLIGVLAGTSGCHSIHWQDPFGHRLRAQVMRLAGTSWRAEAIEGEAVLPGTDTTVEFGFEAGIAGNTGCNPYVSRVFLERGSMRFENVLTAEMDCSAQFLEQERRFVQALTAVRRLRLASDWLVLLDENGAVLIKLKRLPALRWSPPQSHSQAAFMDGSMS